MKTYIGTKIINAEPMDKLTFHRTERKFVDCDESSENVAGYRVVYADGYVSWSPAATFNASYRVISDSEKALIGGIFETGAKAPGTGVSGT